MRKAMLMVIFLFLAIAIFFQNFSVVSGKGTDGLWKLVLVNKHNGAMTVVMGK